MCFLLFFILLIFVWFVEVVWRVLFGFLIMINF